MNPPPDKPDPRERLRRALAARFADGQFEPAEGPGLESLAVLAGRGSCRAFTNEPVDADLIRLLSAVALSAPSKSDLQQRDIVLVTAPALRAKIDALVGGQAWVAGAPALLIVCGNHARQRLVHKLRGRPFANDHLDAFFNAAVDAAIALGALVSAAEAVGLGCCPISAVRNEAEAVSELLALPEHVFPVAGLALGWPAAAAEISPRLPLAATLHENRFEAELQAAAIEAYDRARAAAQPYAAQRYTEDFGVAEDYGWSEDKARQYAKPERAKFGAFVRAKGFKLE